ncbi:M60 family metallopeptidase [Sphingobacterium composti Ten et al. 2007 non Yoo et al. 2007]|uniref:M60 family metallopeptidase n=1 Tax=Sphingobacterium composti TaxID=363260 RepID=UPI00135CD03A|nr:M60 family metallopeptidase [Sphingobacterium composti Ten et al. 2007 non Yoo et al. 2007]
MNRYIKFLGLSFAVFLTIACKKASYDFQDGWQKGEEQGINPQDSSLTYVDRSKYDKARLFPGLVGETVKRVQDTSVTLNLDYRYISYYDLKVQEVPQPIFSVGLYAPAGENIKIVVPEGINGLTIQIGPHGYNLDNDNEPITNRDDVVSTSKALFPGTNYIRNPYGGLIWILSTIAIKNTVSLTFSNVVRTSDYIMDVSNQEQWLRDVEANDVPWLELRSKRVIFTVPRSLVLQYKSELNVKEALTKWKQIYEEDFYKWMGLTANNTDPKNSFPELPERAVLDIQLLKPYYSLHGSPWVAYMDKYWMTQLASGDKLLKDSISTIMPVYHASGHNYQMWRAWNWGALQEVTSNLFAFKAAKRVGIPITTVSDEVRRIIIKSLLYAERNTKKDFNNSFNDGEDGYHRLTPFLQIFEKVKGKNGESGWDFMTKLYTDARNTNIAFFVDAAKIDYFYRSLCAFTGQDYGQFMDAWGIKVSLSARNSMRIAFPPLQKAIWTYNPLTGTGGDEAIAAEYDLRASDFKWSTNMITATNESIGKIEALFDGQSNTYWHTCWENCSKNTTASESEPTYLDLDMQEVKTFRGVYLQNRQGATYRNKAIVYTKDAEDGAWTKQGELILAEDRDDPTRDARKELKFSQLIQARYIRFAFTENNFDGNAHTAIAEAGAFYSPN